MKEDNKMSELSIEKTKGDLKVGSFVGTMADIFRIANEMHLNGSPTETVYKFLVRKGVQFNFND